MSDSLARPQGEEGGGPTPQATLIERRARRQGLARRGCRLIGPAAARRRDVQSGDAIKDCVGRVAALAWGKLAGILLALRCRSEHPLGCDWMSVPDSIDGNLTLCWLGSDTAICGFAEAVGRKHAGD